jgi:hypothetical protein
MKACTLNNGSVQPSPNGLAHKGDCHCPVCDSVISAEAYAAILGRQRTHDAEIIGLAETRFAAQKAAIRREAAAATNALFADRLANAEQEKKVAQKQIPVLQATFKLTLKRQLEAQAEAAAKGKDRAVNAATEQHVVENLRLHAMVQELTRTLEKKTANERGEEGEVDLLALLQSEPDFAGDTFERVAKGVAGPDIIQGVISNGTVVGRIVFDAKNHKRWSGTWTRKLHQDAVDLDAEHAVLVVSPTAFPAEERHHGLLYRDGVMVASAARLIPIVHLMRKQAIRAHVRALSSESRTEKADKLYLLMTSSRVASLWQQHAAKTRSILEIERSDAVWQEKTRGRRVELVDGLRLMIDQELVAEIDRIIAGGSWEASQ